MCANGGSGAWTAHPFAVVSARDEHLLGPAPQFTGRHGVYVEAVVSDGAGGWYVGGQFERVDGRMCPNLVHVRAAARVGSGDCPRPSRPVLALAAQGADVYVAGGFTSIGGERRQFLAALSRRDGRRRSWDARLSAQPAKTVASPFRATLSRSP
jgi:hypothetical protein